LSTKSPTPESLKEKAKEKTLIFTILRQEALSLMTCHKDTKNSTWQAQW
jgi:hypothetical protein